MAINCDNIIVQADCIYDQLICSPKDQSAAIVIGLLACLISAVEAGGGGSSTASEYIWEECFQYLNGEDELVSFTRRFTENLSTHVVTEYDYDKLTGDPVVVPPDTSISVCPSCCDETNVLLQSLVDPHADIPWLSYSSGEEDVTSAISILGPAGVGNRYEIRYLQVGNAGQADTFDLYSSTGGIISYTLYLVVGAIWATRFNKQDYIYTAENDSLDIGGYNAGSDNMTFSVEYRIVPV